MHRPRVSRLSLGSGHDRDCHDQGRLHWTLWSPILAAVVLVATWGRHPADAALVLVGLVLVGAVLAAVHHAEVVAHRVGEPFGSLLLAVAVTVIEVALIVTLMVSGGEGTATLARDTVFAAVMITVNGIVGLVLLVSALQAPPRRVQRRRRGRGARHHRSPWPASAWSCPTFTVSEPGPEFTSSQLAFAAVASLALYVLFVVHPDRAAPRLLPARRPRTA